MEKVSKSEKANKAPAKKDWRHTGRGKRRPSFVWPSPSVVPRCTVCFKPEGVCFCPDIEAQTNSVEIVILQHPSEARNPESTARLASLAWSRVHHVIGLSWRSLGDVLENKKVNPQQWAVVYLGGLKGGREIIKDGSTAAIGRDGVKLAKNSLKGLIFIDGNWRQAKTLWWRNPWLNRLNRLVLAPAAPSNYSGLRKQPRKECLSTIEAVGQALDWVMPQINASERMTAILDTHLAMVSDFKRALRAAPISGMAPEIRSPLLEDDDDGEIQTSESPIS